MAGPGDEMAEKKKGGAAGRVPMRASHADREQVIEALKDAFAHGRADQGRTRRAGRSGAGRAITADISAPPGAPLVRAAPLPQRW